MTEFTEVECKYCGCYLDVSRAVKLNIESGEYEYACEGCAIKWKDKNIAGNDENIQIN